MSHAGLIEHVLSAIVDVTPDLLGEVLHALNSSHFDLSAIPQDVLVDTIVDALTLVGGAAVTGLVAAHRDEVAVAVRRSLA